MSDPDQPKPNEVRVRGLLRLAQEFHLSNAELVEVLTEGYQLKFRQLRRDIETKTARRDVGDADDSGKLKSAIREEGNTLRREAVEPLEAWVKAGLPLVVHPENDPSDKDAVYKDEDQRRLANARNALFGKNGGFAPVLGGRDGALTPYPSMMQSVTAADVKEVLRIKADMPDASGNRSDVIPASNIDLAKLEAPLAPGQGPPVPVLLEKSKIFGADAPRPDATHGDAPDTRKAEAPPTPDAPKEAKPARLSPVDELVQLVTQYGITKAQFAEIVTEGYAEQSHGIQMDVTGLSKDLGGQKETLNGLVGYTLPYADNPANAGLAARLVKLGKKNEKNLQKEIRQEMAMHEAEVGSKLESLAKAGLPMVANEGDATLGMMQAKLALFGEQYGIGTRYDSQKDPLPFTPSRLNQYSARQVMEAIERLPGALPVANATMDSLEIPTKGGQSPVRQRE